MNIRIIPRLDIKGPNLVKGIHLEGLRVLGSPENFARFYYETGADELMYVDVVASLYNRNSLHDIISRTAREIFIPLTVGGGLRTVEDIRSVLRAGADKVSLNTAAINNPEIIRQASRMFGSSTIVVAIEAIKQTDGSYLAYTDNGRQITGIEVVSWAQRVEDLGAGEIIITSVDREGTGLGFDLELTKQITDAVSIPVIAHGGAGKLEHVVRVIQNAGANAVSIASMFHYDFIKINTKERSSNKEGNVVFLESGRGFSMVDATNLKELKKHLLTHHIECRHEIDNSAS
jgi:cyclase